MKTNVQISRVESVEPYPELRVVERRGPGSSLEDQPADGPNLKPAKDAAFPRPELDALGWKPRAKRLGRRPAGK